MDEDNRKDSIASDDMNCFDKLIELKKHKCTETDCEKPCTKIVKGNQSDKFYCNYHFNKEFKEGKIKRSSPSFSLFPIARILFKLGLVRKRTTKCQ